LPTLPSSLRELYCSNNKIGDLPQLPKGIEEVHATNNRGDLRITANPRFYLGVSNRIAAQA